MNQCVSRLPWQRWILPPNRIQHFRPRDHSLYTVAVFLHSFLHEHDCYLYVVEHTLIIHIVYYNTICYRRTSPRGNMGSRFKQRAKNSLVRNLVCIRRNVRPLRKHCVSSNHFKRGRRSIKQGEPALLACEINKCADSLSMYLPIVTKTGLAAYSGCAMLMPCFPVETLRPNVEPLSAP